jgi:SAM-dependent methyltransferase
MSSSTELMWSDFSRANSLNPAQRHRWRLVVREVFREGSLPADAVIADLGCGSGSLLRELSQQSARIRCVGLDIEPLALDLARKVLPSGEFHRLDLSDVGLNVPDGLKGAADVVVCSEVLEHLQNPGVAIDFARDLLRPGGKIVMTVPSGAMTPFDRAIGHVRHYDLQSFAELIEREDLRVARIYRWGFPFHSIFRAAVGVFRVVPSQCTDAHFGRLTAVAFRILHWLFFFNLKSRRWGRQLVAVAYRNRAS